MKLKMKRQVPTELPRFIVGALATAGASTASGATVQISFANNVVSSATGTTNFVADLTGDGNPEVNYLLMDGLAYVGLGIMLGGAAAQTLDGPSYRAFLYNAVARAWVVYDMGTGNRGGRGLLPIAFSDSRINAGATTSGWLDVGALAGATLLEVQIHRLFFDNESTTAPTGLTWESTGIPGWQVSAVPEPGSNLALLALGAGGLTLRRRLKRAA